MRELEKYKENLFERYKKDQKNLYNAITDYKEVLEQQGKNAPGMLMCHYDIVNQAFLKFYTGYSLGYNLSELNDDVKLIIHHTLACWHDSVYGDIEKALELAIIFNIQSIEIDKLIKLLKEYNYNDLFLEILAHYINPQNNIETDKLQFKKAIGPLVEIVELAEIDKNKSVERLKIYLEKQWFNMQKEGRITNKDHLKKDKYRGYWSIEAAALVKMLNLDDEELKGCKYYPYDLAHYNRN
ncbi:MAG: DUF1911 domain-containing protein [Clostridium butyricum]|nr:DUF1911 domain-containing protein [Clostridium butyricum]